MQKYYYTIYSNTSRNSVHGLRPRVGFMSLDDIIDAADRELSREGRVFEDLAGIDWIEDEDGMVKPERAFLEGETLALSIEKLGDDGRLFEAYENPDEFVVAAERYGLGDDARAECCSF